MCWQLLVLSINEPEVSTTSQVMIFNKVRKEEEQTRETPKLLANMCVTFANLEFVGPLICTLALVFKHSGRWIR